MARKKTLIESEIAICKRLGEWRRKHGFPRVTMARHSGVDSITLANVERGLSPLRFGVARRLMEKFKINPIWLATGEDSLEASGAQMPPFAATLADDAELYSRVYHSYLEQYLREDRMQRLLEWFATGDDFHVMRDYAASLLHERADGWFKDFPTHRLFNYLQDLLEFGDNYVEQGNWDREPSAGVLTTPRPSEKKNLPGLDIINTSFNIAAVTKVLPSTFEDLLKRLKIATESHGAKTALAKEMGVSPQRLNGWLNGWTTPDGSVTLRLLQWVLKAETQKQGGPGGASNTAKAKTQARKSDENASSGP